MNELEIVKERIEAAITKLESHVEAVIAPLGEDLRAEYKNVILPALLKVWNDLLANVESRIKMQTSTGPDTAENPGPQN